MESRGQIKRHKRDGANITPLARVAAAAVGDARTKHGLEAEKQARHGSTRPDQTRPDQTRSEQEEPPLAS
jgi:hypothetical protein